MTHLYVLKFKSIMINNMNEFVKIEPLKKEDGYKIYEKHIMKAMTDIQEVANFYNLYEFKGQIYALVTWCDGSVEMIGIYPKSKERVQYSPYDEKQNWYKTCKTNEELFNHFAKDLKGLD